MRREGWAEVEGRVAVFFVGLWPWRIEMFSTHSSGVCEATESESICIYDHCLHVGQYGLSKIVPSEFVMGLCMR